MASDSQLVLTASESEALAARPQSHAGRWRFALIGLGTLAVLAAAGAFLSRALSVEKLPSTLSHKVQRGDLVVTVTEQGMLESSNNTEIKCKVRGYSTVIWVIDDGTEVKKGDVLVRLDTKQIEDAVSTHTTNVHTARATLAESKAALARAKIAVKAYLEGTYQLQKQSLEQQVLIARQNLLTACKLRDYSRKLFKRGFVTELEVQAHEFAVQRAQLELNVLETQLRVLEQYTKKMEQARLEGDVRAAAAKVEADKAGLAMDEGRLALAKEELENCVIRAPHDGLVIYPTTAEWKDMPEITEGGTVHKDQVLLLMPDLTKMQVKVGIHESVIDRIKPGLPAKVTLPDGRVLDGEVASVAPATRPAGWWTGNVVKYDTIIKLPPAEGLKPGMSAEVKVIIKRYKDVLTVPVAAVLETAEGDFCWVQTPEGPQRRRVRLGDNDEAFVIVKAGLKEGDQVLLNPLAFATEAQMEVLKPPARTAQRQPLASRTAGQAGQ